MQVRIRSLEGDGKEMIHVLDAGGNFLEVEDTIEVHQSRVKPCPGGFMAGYYLYANKRKGPGHPPKWVKAAFTGERMSETDIVIEPQG